VSITAIDAVLKSDVGPVNKRMLLVAIADNATDVGLCKPGIEYLVGKTTIARSTVFRLLGELEAEGLLERRERRRANGSRRSNAYRLNIAELERRRRVVSKKETDELEALFEDDDPTELDNGVAAGQPHSPGAGPCVDEHGEPPGGPHGPGAGPSSRMVPERDGGSPAAGRNGGPAAGPLEPSLERQGGTGGAGSAVDRPTAEPAPTRNDPPSPVIFSIHDRDTWLCRRHRDAPPAADEDIPACGPCGRTVRWAQTDRRRKGLPTEPGPDELADLERERDRQRARACGWCDDRFVLDPETGLPFEPAVRCDHETTAPAAVRELVEAGSSTPVPVSSAEARAAAIAQVRASCRPARPHRGRSSGAPPAGDAQVGEARVSA